ncbi:MAG: PEP-CTERM sorting domain-containing protein [Desulfobacterales bacterium]|nr:PEP-CTERM sorting domain-containing protein [Desulfobacterales bacterium]
MIKKNLTSRCLPLLVTALILLWGGHALALTITYGTADNGLSTITDTVDGITLTLGSPRNELDETVTFGATSNGIGFGYPGSSYPLNNLVLTFSADVVLTSFRFPLTDTSAVTEIFSYPFTITGPGSTSGNHDSLLTSISDNRLSYRPGTLAYLQANQAYTLAFVTDVDIIAYLDEIQFSRYTATNPIPEPGSMMLMGSGLLVLLGRIRSD